MKNNILYSILISITVILAACNHQLDLEPQNSIDDSQALNNAEGVGSAVIGAYSYLGTAQAYGSDFNLASELLGSENYIFWRGSFTQYTQIADKNMLIDNSSITADWDNTFEGINVCNNIISARAVVTDKALEDQYYGEALFIRGSFYFETLRFFAPPWDPAGNNNGLGLPIVLQPTKNFNDALTRQSRNTVAEVYAQSISDLDSASKLLPETYGSPTTDRSRATKFTALAMLARLYLQQSQFAKARDAANTVIESGQYTLNSNPDGVFSGKNTTESIFEIQQNDQHTAFDANNGLTTFYGDYESSPQGRGDVSVQSDFYDSYADNDIRKSVWFSISGDLAPRSGQLFTTKWRENGQNIPVLRLPEMLLIRAECNIRLGTAVGALPVADLDAIRSRAGLNTIISPTVADILQERRWELCFEGFRIHDIKRTKGKTGDYDWNDPKLVFPIPQSAIEANNNLIQNAGY